MSIVYINVPFFSTLVSGFVPEKTSPSSIILSAPSFLYASHLSSFFSNSVLNIWKEREGGREGERERGREGEREGRRERGRERGREGGREGEREGSRKGEREGGREGGRERRSAIGSLSHWQYGTPHTCGELYASHLHAA